MYEIVVVIVVLLAMGIFAAGPALLEIWELIDKWRKERKHE